MRIHIRDDDRDYLFKQLSNNNFTSAALSIELGVSSRTITDWKLGKYTIPAATFNTLCELAMIDIKSLNLTQINERDQRRKAGSVGGRIQWQKNGRIGTLDDKKKGGQKSFAKRREISGDIFTRKEVNLPSISVLLAEFVGICMGDGSITNYQVTISLNNETDLEYIQYVSTLVSKLFGINVRLQCKAHAKCINIVLSSVKLVEYMLSLGLPKGDKIRAGLDLPAWVKNDSEFTKACVRGLFDTDGSIFLETHRIKNASYSYPRMSFVSASESLRYSVCIALCEMGFDAKIRMNRSVNLERFTDIKNYFRIVGSSNNKHVERFAAFGGVG